MQNLLSLCKTSKNVTWHSNWPYSWHWQNAPIIRIAENNIWRMKQRSMVIPKSFWYVIFKKCIFVRENSFRHFTLFCEKMWDHLHRWGEGAAMCVIYFVPSLVQLETLLTPWCNLEEFWGCSKPQWVLQPQWAVLGSIHADTFSEGTGFRFRRSEFCLTEIWINNI